MGDVSESKSEFERMELKDKVVVVGYCAAPFAVLGMLAGLMLLKKEYAPEMPASPKGVYSADLNADGVLDEIVETANGTFIYLSQKDRSRKELSDLLDEQRRFYEAKAEEVKKNYLKKE